MTAWVVSTAVGQGTLPILFEGNPALPPGTSISVQQYFESGMWFRPLGIIEPGNTISHRRGGGQLSGAPDNGTAYLAAHAGSSLVFSFENGSLFGVAAIDLAEYSTVVPNAVTVPFIGYRQDGSTVSTNFTTDGIIDGVGPIKDFQTFYFGSDWSFALTRVEVPSYGWSLDNLVISVPEPSSRVLLGIGALTIFIYLSRPGCASITPKLMSVSEFKFYCSHCDQPLKCEPQFAGRQIQCPACQHLIRIPNPPAGTGFTHVEPQSGHTWDTHVPKGQKS